MLKEMPDDIIVIEVEATQIIVKGSHTEFKLPTANPDEYPSCKKFEAESYHSISARVFSDAIRRTAWATDPDSSRFALGGVLCNLDDSGCSMIGTDGKRLAAVTFAGEVVGEHSTHGQSVVPSRAASVIQRSLADGEGFTKVAIDATNISIEYAGIVIGSRLVEGRYPNWKQVIPDRSGEGWQRIEISSAPLNTVIRQASIVADKDTRGLDFTFGDGMLIVGAQAVELGSSVIELPIAWDAERLKTRLDFRYLGQFIQVLNAGETMSLEIASATKPVVLSSRDTST